MLASIAMHSPSVTRDAAAAPMAAFSARCMRCGCRRILRMSAIDADGPAVCPGDAALSDQDGKILTDGLPRNAELVAERSDPDPTVGVHEPDDGPTAFARERVY